MLGADGLYTCAGTMPQLRLTCSSDLYCTAGVSLMVNPPNKGSESYNQFMRMEHSPVEPLLRRVQIMTDEFNALLCPSFCM